MDFGPSQSLRRPGPDGHADPGPRLTKPTWCSRACAPSPIRRSRRRPLPSRACGSRRSGSRFSPATIRSWSSGWRDWSAWCRPDPVGSDDRSAERRGAGRASRARSMPMAGLHLTRSRGSSARCRLAARRRLSGRRHQRRAGAEGRRYRSLGRRRNRRRAGRRRHDPAATDLGRRRRRRRGRPAHLRQHPQICAHGRELQFRQHAVDGGRVDAPAVPADAADADPAQQPALRSLRTRHPLRHRRVRRQRPGRNCGT